MVGEILVEELRQCCAEEVECVHKQIQGQKNLEFAPLQLLPPLLAR